MKVALTGGIAAGKTTAMEILKSFGVKVFYADEIARNIVENDRAVIAEMKQYFKGYDIAGKDTVFDRKKLSELVFSSKERVDYINNLIHPLVKKQIESLFRDYEAEDIVVEIPLLFEAKMQNMFDASILVFAPAEERLKRCLERNKDITAEEVRKRMGFQMDEDEKKKLADIVIVNQHDINDMKNDIKKIWVNLKNQRRFQCPKKVKNQK